MFKSGDYVRLKIAPNTRIGTIEGSKIEKSYTQYLFRQDKRVTSEANTPDFYVFDDEIERCARSTDVQIQRINRLIERGS
jgi:hypothetical protein